MTLLASQVYGVRPSRAQAPEASCEAVEKTEAMRAEGRYRESRVRLLECVNAQCGGDVRRRCAAALQKLDASTPSIVIRAADPSGDDVLDVAVSLGDEPLVSSLDGMAIAVDPGEHHFVFTRPGYAPVLKVIEIAEGEKFRAIDVVIGADPAPAPSATEETRVSDSGGTERAIASGTLIGIGAVGVASYIWLGTSARSGEDELQGCAPNCSQGKVDSVETRYVLANVSIGVGVLALGAATWLLLSAPSGDTVAEPSSRGLAIGADGRGAFASYSGRF
jgi:hypothetical protein